MFFENYDIYASENEAPPIYHRWAALSVMACLVSRRVWIDQGIFTIFPNLYIIFVGQPGNGKSTAMRIGRKMVLDMGDIPVAPASITKEMITKTMGGEEASLKQTFMWNDKAFNYTPFNFFANELTDLLGPTPGPIITFFTSIYDEEVHIVSTKRAGIDNIEGPCVNLLGCMTPDVTTQLLKQNIISGGFNRRCVFVNAPKRGKGKPRPKVTDAMRDAYDNCLKWGKTLKKVSGQFTWTTEAEEFFDAWYEEKDKMLSTHSDIVTLGYYTTKDVMLLKIAMLIALSDSTDLVLRKTHLERGLEMLEFTERYLSRVFTGTGRNELVDMKTKLLTMLESRYPTAMMRKQIEADLYDLGTSDEIAEVLKHMEIAGLIKKGATPQGWGTIELVRKPK